MVVDVCKDHCRNAKMIILKLLLYQQAIYLEGLPSLSDIILLMM